MLDQATIHSARPSRALYRAKWHVKLALRRRMKVRSDVDDAKGNEAGDERFFPRFVFYIRLLFQSWLHSSWNRFVCLSLICETRIFHSHNVGWAHWFVLGYKSLDHSILFCISQSLWLRLLRKFSQIKNRRNKCWFWYRLRKSNFL